MEDAQHLFITPTTNKLSDLTLFIIETFPDKSSIKYLQLAKLGIFFYFFLFFSYSIIWLNIYIINKSFINLLLVFQSDRLVVERLINEFKYKFNIQEPSYTNDKLEELNNKLTLENYNKFSSNNFYAKYKVDVSYFI